eukprot:gene18442-26001_t
MQGTRMFKFEWDNQKAQSNLLKHGVSFDEAVSVFGDALALTFSDSDHSMDEDRSRTYGISTKERLLVVVHTERRNSIRIISARKRDQLGKGVRGKYLKHFVQGSNVVVLQPEILKAFPTSEAVNKALASMLAFAHETQVLSVRTKTATRKRLAAS